MNLSTQTQQTMLSTEIAALTGKRHDHVIRDIEIILKQLNDDSPDLGSGFKSSTYLAGNGKQEKCYQLDYDSTMVVLTGYDVVARAKVIKRWQELEQQATKPIDPMQVLNDPAAMRGLLLTYSEKVISLESKVEEQAPKVAAFELLTGSEGTVNVTNAAKTLGVQPKKLFQWLQANRWIYRRAGGSGFVAYQDKIQSGVLEHKVSTIQKDDGSDKMTEQVRVTPKGLEKLAKVTIN